MPNAAQVVLQLQSQVAPQIAATVSAYGQLSAAEQKAAQSAAVYAKTQLQVAQADVKVATEEQRLAVQTANAAKAQDQASLVALRLAKAQSQVGSSGGFASQLTDSFTSSITGIIGPAAIATATLAALKGSFDLAVASESNARVERSFESLAKQAGTTGDTILASLRKASGGEISDLNLELAVNKGLLLGVANSATQFADIMVIARDRAAKMGITTTQAFDDITTGIGRESPRILDNLGIIVDADQANQKYASSIGKSVDQLTKAERIEALRNQVIAQGKGTLDAATTAANDQNNSFARAGTVLENTKNAFGEFIKGGLKPTADNIVATATATQQFIDYMAQAKAAIFGAQQAASGGGGAFEFFTAKIIANGGAFNAYAAAVGGAGSEAQTTAAKIQFAAQAMDISARASVADAAAKDAQQAKTALLTAESNKAVTSFIGLNPQIDAAGVAALIAAGKLDPFIGRLIALQIESGKARDKLIELNNAAAQEKLNGIVKLRSSEGIGSGRGGGSDANAEADAFVSGLKKQNDAAKGAAEKAAAEAKRLQDARDALNLARAKTSAQKIAELQRQQAATSDPVEKIQLQTQIEQERNSAAKSHTGELGKQLTLQEGIYDSVNKQKDALLDIEELTIKDRQQDRKDAQDARSANAIIARLGGRNDARANELRGIAQDKLALANVQDRQRAAAIAEKQATAGGSIVNGRLLQSQSGGPLVPAPGGGGAGPLPSAPGQPAGAPATGGQQTLMLVLTDSAGVPLAKLVSPIIFDDLMGAIRQGHMSVGVG